MYEEILIEKGDEMRDFEMVRNLMSELASVNGYLINPICLQNYILKYLVNKSPKNKMNSLKAKNASLIFAILCNEYFLLNQNRVPDITEFYMSTDRWNKHSIKQGMRENSLKILKELDLISYYNKRNITQNFGYVRMYKINTQRLNEILLEILIEKSCA